MNQAIASLPVLPPVWVESLPEEIQSRMEGLQPFLRAKLFTLGDEGFNNNLMGCARSLKRHFNREELKQILTACGDAYDRPIEEREIEKAVAKAFDESPQRDVKRWPDYSPELVRDVLSRSEVKSPDGLAKRFENEQEGTEAILKDLFPGDPLVCLGEARHKFSTKRLSEHLKSDVSKMQFIVPSPMSKPKGLTQEGKESAHCLDNTGPRKFLVIDFDKGTEQEQAACIEHLATFAPLVLIVKSGNKSLHAWFACQDTTEADLERFMAYCVTLGGDPALFTKSQFARTPGATRDNGNTQSVVTYCPFNVMLSEWRANELPEIEKTEERKEGFQLVHISDIPFSTEATDFVQDLLFKGEVSVILAAPGVGKSFFAIDLAACVAQGRPWRDRETEQGAVIYICLEGVTGFRKRLEAFRRAGRLSDSKEECPFFLVEQPLNLLKPEHAKQLIQAIKQEAEKISVPIAWIVIDTLSRSMPGANENGSEEMSGMLSNVQKIQSATGAHVSLVHHTGKDSSKGARGHSSLFGGINTEILLTKDVETKIIVASSSKQKDEADSQKFPFRLQRVPLGFNDKGREMSSCIVEHLPESDAPPKKGRPPKDEPGALLDLLPARSMGHWQASAEDELQIPRGRFYKLKKALPPDSYRIESGEIVRWDNSENHADGWFSPETQATREPAETKESLESPKKVSKDIREPCPKVS